MKIEAKSRTEFVAKRIAIGLGYDSADWRDFSYTAQLAINAYIEYQYDGKPITDTENN